MIWLLGPLGIRTVIRGFQMNTTHHHPVGLIILSPTKWGVLEIPRGLPWIGKHSREAREAKGTRGYTGVIYG